MAELITLDITTLTLGEASAAEIASGLSIQQMTKSRVTLRLLAMFVTELRSSATPRSWQELSNLRLLDALSSISQSQQDGQSVKSNG